MFGIEINDEQLAKMALILMTFFVFQLDISGNEIIDEQHLNNPFISSTCSIFHLEISGIEINDEQKNLSPETKTKISPPNSSER